MLVSGIVSCLHSYFLLLLDQKERVDNGALLSSKFWELCKYTRQVGLESQPNIKIDDIARATLMK